MNQTKHPKSPWAWVSTLYFVEGLPYVAVMTLSVILYKRLGISNTDIALYTGWLYLPWVIKPFWSPFVDLLKTKRWWIVSMQLVLAIAFAGIAFTIPTSAFFQLTLAIFWIIAFMSATHDIAADGFYMHALSEHEQSFYVGIRSTFYRIATVAGQGLLVILAGLIETNSGWPPARLQVEAAPHTIEIKNQPGKKEKVGPYFIYTPILFETESAFQTDSLIRSIQKHNERCGFVRPAKEQHDKVQKTATQEGKLTRWLRQTFGEKRMQTVQKSDRAILVGIRLVSPTPQNTDKNLHIQFKSGDPGIHLEQTKLSPLFNFSNQNRKETAYMLFFVDSKIKSRTTATFEGVSGNIPFAWCVVFLSLSILFLLVSLYHNRVLPRPQSDKAQSDITVHNIGREFIHTFRTFFTKPQAVPAILFMLLYRLPEAQLVKLINPFLLDPIDKGGLGLSTGEVGIVYGTIGIIGLTLGGIIGGLAAARGGLKRWLWPMALSMSLTCITFVYLSYAQSPSLMTINICVFIEQFGYGFGFTAYMLFLIYFSEGAHKTSHYAICTGFMALGMMLPGMASGWLQEAIGYRHFFIWTMMCCLATVLVCLFIRIDPSFGKKRTI